MTKTVKETWREEIYDKYSDKGNERFGLAKHNNAVLERILDDVQDVISQVEALVRKQTVEDIHKILFNNDSKGTSLVERYAKANNIII